MPLYIYTIKIQEKYLNLNWDSKSDLQISSLAPSAMDHITLEVVEVNSRGEFERELAGEPG